MADQQLKINFRSLTDIVVAEEADTPLVVRCVTPSVPRGQASTGGTMSNPAKMSVYVRIDGLPKELAERVRTAVEALSWA